MTETEKLPLDILSKDSLFYADVSDELLLLKDTLNLDDKDKEEQAKEIDKEDEKEKLKSVLTEAKAVLEGLKEKILKKSQSEESNKTNEDVKEMTGDIDAQITRLSDELANKIESFEQLIEALSDIEEEVQLAIEFAKADFEQKANEVNADLRTEFSESVEKAIEIVSKKENKDKAFEEFSKTDQFKIHLAANELLKNSNTRNSNTPFVIDISENITSENLPQNLKNIIRNAIDNKDDKSEKQKILELYIINELENNIPKDKNDEDGSNNMTFYLSKKNGKFTFVTTLEKDKLNKTDEKKVKDVQEAIENADLPEWMDEKEQKALQEVVTNQTSYNNEVTSKLEEGGLLANIMRWILGMVGINLNEVVKTDTTLGKLSRMITGVEAPQKEISPLDNKELTETINDKYITNIIDEIDNGIEKSSVWDRTGEAGEDEEAKSLISPILGAYGDARVTSFSSTGKNTQTKTMTIATDSKSTFTKIYAFLSPSSSEGAMGKVVEELNKKFEGAGDTMGSMTNLFQEYSEKGGLIDVIAPSSDYEINGFTEFTKTKQSLFKDINKDTNHEKIALQDRLSLSLTASGEIQVTWSSKNPDTKKKKKETKSAKTNNTEKATA